MALAAAGTGAAAPRAPAAPAPVDAKVEVLYFNAPGDSFIQNHQIAGARADALDEALHRAGIGFDARMVSFPAAMAELDASPMTLVMGIVRNPEREAKYTWLALIEQVPHAFIVLNGRSAPTSFAAAHAFAPIGAWRESVMVQELADRSVGPITTCYEDVDCARLLMAGRIGAWYGNSGRVRAAWTLLGRDPAELVAGPTLVVVDAYLAARADFPPDLAARLRAAWDSLRADGTLTKIARRYNSHLAGTD